jgi:hypothetical protein
MSEQGNGGGRSIHVPGMVPTGPAIVTSRLELDDGFTYDGYVRTAATRPSAAH